MKLTHTANIALLSLVGLVVCAWALPGRAGDVPEQRFYVAPMFSYGMFDEDTVDPDDALGGQLSVGKSFGDHVALELFGFGFNDADVEVAGHKGNIDSFGYGLSALLFPMRDVFPLFVVVGLGEGEYDFDPNAGFGPTIGDAGNQDMDFYDIGIGFLIPVTDYGIAIRGEYRYRNAEVDAEDGGSYQFRNDILSLGVQIPLGSKPKPVAASAPEPIPMAKDSDRDGVMDRGDACPDTPIDSLVNTRGCTKAAPMRQPVVAAPIVLKGVHFKYDSAHLTAKAEDRLDNVVDALKSASDIHVLIAGHTDSTGSATYNLRLSGARAEAVKTYLVDHGIDADRLTARGFGESRPIEPNNRPDGSDYPTGRAMNRRVELHITNQ